MAVNLPELEQEVKRALDYHKPTFTLDTSDMMELVRLAKLAQEQHVTQKQVFDYAYGDA